LNHWNTKPILITILSKEYQHFFSPIETHSEMPNAVPASGKGSYLKNSDPNNEMNANAPQKNNLYSACRSAAYTFKINWRGRQELF